MKTAEDWEKLLASEGMPAELRLMTQSSVVARNGLVCVSSSNKDDAKFENTTPYFGREWTMNANLKHHGSPTAVSDLDVAQYWRLFSSLIWESGITGSNLEFLLEFAEGKELAPLARKYNLTLHTSTRLIAFIWSTNEHGNRSDDCQCSVGPDCGCPGKDRSGN
jgi:hypothetical protein